MYQFIINPHARSGLGGQVWHVLEPILKEREIPYNVHFTRFQRHATSIVRSLTSDGQEHTLVVLGGDGTVNEAINGIVDFSNVTLGYIPIGSSNDFARSFGLPKDPVKALDMILNPSEYSMMDVGVLSYKERRRRFAVSTGAGFDAAICHEAVISKLKVLLNRVKLGKLTYAGIALNRIFYLRPATVNVTLDNEKPMTFSHVMFVVAMNHPYEGGGFRFCPRANPSDGQLNVMVISGVSKLKALCLLPFALNGKHIYFKGVHTFTCKKVAVESDLVLPLHTDGEPVFLQKKWEAALEPDKLRIITK